MAGGHVQTIERFYEAFNAHDGITMAECYAPDATFSDPVFTDLRGREPGAMWRMLTGRSTDLEVDLLEHDAGEETGTAHWVARYTFEGGRKVTNDVRASMRFEDGLIAEHRDEFDFYAWARQALGPPGVLLGWTPILRNSVRKRARAQLDEFMAGEDERPAAAP